VVQLAANQPHRSKEPQVVVENPLKPGRYRFSLVVVDDALNESEPAEITVTVVEPTRPERDPTRPVLRPEILRATETIRRPVITPIRPIRPS
jgi:hypothetical protein